MSVFIELVCINFDDPSTADCFSLLEKGVFSSAEDTQASVLATYKYIQALAHDNGWRWARLAQGAKGWLCPSCVILYQEQTGLSLN